MKTYISFLNNARPVLVKLKIWSLSFIGVVLCLTLACTQDAFAQSHVVEVIIPVGASTQKCSPACFVPSDISIPENTTISWQNRDVLGHTITSGQPSYNATGTLFDSGLVPPGGHFEHTFNNPGTFRYFDLVHPWDVGVVRVSQNPGSVQPIITTSTDRESYYAGDTITITGGTNRFVSNSITITITITDPHKNVVFSRSMPMQQNTNSYKMFVPADSKFTMLGRYKVFASYAGTTSKTYFDFNPVPPTEKILKTTIDSSEQEIPRGGSTHLGFDFKLDRSYTMGSLELSLEGLPDGVLSWINPPRLDSSINSNHTMDAEIPLFVNSGTNPGSYTVYVMGDGNVLNDTSGKDLSFQHQRIASIHLKIMPSGGSLSLEVGSPEYNGTQFCTGPQGTTHMCTGFVSSEEFPITVISDKHQRVTLDALAMPKDGYVKFLPDAVYPSGNGSVSHMIMAGIMEPFGINPFDTTAMAVRATSEDGSTAVSYIPIIDRGGITILSKPGPIKPQGNLISSGSQIQIIPFGVVYDPCGSPRTLPVKLDPLGLVNGSHIVPFTKSFGVTIPRDSFVLNSSEPYYFMVESMATSLPSGKITFALGEDEGEKQFVQNVTLEISNVHFGGIPQGGPGGVKLEKAEPSQTSDPWTLPVMIGGLAGGGAGMASFLALRRRSS